MPSQTFTLSPNNPSQSISITAPYGIPISFSIKLTNAKPNTTYTLNITGIATYHLNTDRNGVAETFLATSPLYSNTTIRVCITGPCIPSAYTLILNVTVQS